jgi:hypothetical protein
MYESITIFIYVLHLIDVATIICSSLQIVYNVVLVLDLDLTENAIKLCTSRLVDEQAFITVTGGAGPSPASLLDLRSDAES